jgi:cysteine synthase
VFASATIEALSSILDAIGNTPLVRLTRCAPPNGAELWLKLEYANPTGVGRRSTARHRAGHPQHGRTRCGARRPPHHYGTDQFNNLHPIAHHRDHLAREIWEQTTAASRQTGANVVGAHRLAERLRPEAVIVTLAADSGFKYMSTPPYAALDAG